MNKVLKELLSTGLYLLFVLLMTWLLITYVIQRTDVDGESMETTLSDGDNLFVDKITYRFHDPERYDVIVFLPYEYDKDTHYIKRVIGLPGETVQIDVKGNIYIDGEILTETYGREIIRPENIGVAEAPIVLGEDEYFVMGDNRNNSKDSRSEAVGNIHRSAIVGRAWLRIWPFEKLGFLQHG